ncbi:unnamed protein product [Echinostoma caproni]|uniref:ORF3 n=1 Tax=Echinostoma caproni TaxID=27848 RepID=A0A182ZZQ5_9TREM|nr:unnamed protein product [Echinostoma caproni]
MNRRAVGRGVPDGDMCSPVIDLTDDVSGSESLDESMENADAVNNLRISGTLGPGLHSASRAILRGAGTLDAQTLYHTHLRRRAKLSDAVGPRVAELSHIPSRIARRVVTRDNSHPLQPGVPFGMELNVLGEPVPTVCPNVTVDASGIGSGEPYLTVRHGTIPADTAYLSDPATLPGIDLPTTSYPTRLVAISSRPGSSLPNTPMQTRKPVRRPSQLRRTQPVGLQSFPPQWPTGTSDPNCDPMLSGAPPGLSDSALSVPLEESEPCELVDRILPGEMMSVSGISVDGTGSEAPFRGRLIPASGPIMLSSTPVTQLPYDSHTMLERQVRGFISFPFYVGVVCLFHMAILHGFPKVLIVLKLPIVSPV